jgi:arabinofuranosyltransferase
MAWQTTTEPEGGSRQLGASLPRAAPVPTRRDLSAWLVMLPALILLVRGWQRRWVADDGFIHLRVAEQLLHGHGLVFNAGERVETTTSPLWVVLVAIGRAPHLVGIETLAVTIGLCSTVGGVVLAAWAARLLWRHERVGGDDNARGVLLPLGAIVLAVLPPMWDFATSGLETGLVFLWLGGSFLLLARLTTEASRRWSSARWAAAVAGLGPLIRPDLAVFSGVFLLTTLHCARKHAAGQKRQWVALLTTGLGLPCAYEVFRMGYFGALVPNTALAKEASRAWWAQGWRYLNDLVGTYWLWVPLVVVLVLLASGARSWMAARVRADRLLVAAAPLAGGLSHALYVTRVGGDFMHARLLLPSLFAVLMPVAVVEVRGWVRWAMVAVVLPWAVLCFAHLRVHYVVGPDGIADERHFYALDATHSNPVHVDDYATTVLHADGRAARDLLRAGRPALGWRDPVKPVYTSVPLRPGLPFRTGFITGQLGITGIVAGTHVDIIDPSGLSDPIAARIRLQRRGRPGHEKHLDLPWMVARFADPAAPVPDGVSAPAVEAARRALRCGPLRDLQAAVSGRLGVGRFVRNIALSVRLRSFRLDVDPAVAEAQVCRG